MTQQPDQTRQTRSLQLRPVVQPTVGQSVLHVNTFGIAAAQGMVYLDFASFTPTDLAAQKSPAEISELDHIEVNVTPQVRLALPMEAAIYLANALHQQLMHVGVRAMPELEEDS